ncbi:MAG: O-methyltransferase [Bacteroidota bacterium]
MFLPVKYIKYKLNSKGKYKIHSPYVFDLVSKCLALQISPEDQKQTEAFKTSLKNDKRLIQIRDFGAGSHKLGTTRKISDIYKYSATKGVYARLLYQLNRHYACKEVLELGTSLGAGTIHLALGNPSSAITTVDASPETQEVAREQAQKLGLSHINFVCSEFRSYLSKLENKQFDLVFIDGHHDGTALLSYLEQLENFTHADTMFILDDIRWSKGMLAAWEKICTDPHYHLTMDFFRMGIALKRPQQAKEHFVIKLKGVLSGMI